MSNYTENHRYYDILLFFIFIILYYCYLTKDKKWKENLVFLFLIIISINNIVFVNPFTKGTRMIYQKPLFQEIKTIVKKDKNANFIALHSFISPNYLMMAGAKTINSTNIYPNLKLWKKIDPKGKNEEIYNRYAHIVIDLTNEKTSFELIQVDLFRLKLNYNDIKKLGIDYIYSNQKEKTEQKSKIKLEEIYYEDGSYLYKVVDKKD